MAQGQARRLFRVFQVLAFALLFVPGLARAEAGSDELQARVKSFYQSIFDKDIRNYHVRDELSAFFQEPADLSLYLVGVFVHLKKSGTTDFRIRKFKIRNIEIDGQEARVTMEIWSYYLLFIKNSFVQVDRWKFLTPAADKKDWYLVPLPIKEGSK
ncbi:MAG: hypothetical protein PHE84_09350 [bacterium]|nr:hypothetical protein [bacterium]